jgi:hypothetical protein
MTDLEQEAIKTISEVITTFTKRKISVVEFQEIMGKLRDTLKHLQNYSFSCPTGKHASICLCKPAIEGTTVYTAKERVRKGVKSCIPKS